MVDVEHRSLRALEHDAAAFGQNAVEHSAGIGDKRPYLLRGRRVLLIHFFGVEGIGAEERVGDGILLRAGRLNVRFEQRRMQQIDYAKAAAGHLVFVSRPNAAAGGADLLAPWRALRSQLDHAVVGQDDLCAVGDEEIPVDFDAELANAADFAEECDGIEDNSIADDALATRAKHAAGDELQDELVLANDDGVPGVVTAGVARHGGKPLAEHVYDLSLALVAPLGAQYHSRFRSHRRPDSTRKPAAASIFGAACARLVDLDAVNLLRSHFDSK